MYENPKFFNIDLISDAQLLPLYVLPLSASSFNKVYIRFGKNVSLLFKSFTQYFIMLNLRCIMKGTFPSSPYRPLKSVDFFNIKHPAYIGGIQFFFSKIMFVSLFVCLSVCLSVCNLFSVKVFSATT